MRWILSVLTLCCLTGAALFAAEVPRRAPEFALEMPTGKQVLLSQYRGKVVALGFYFTTCPHCQNTCQLMQRLSGEYGARGFQTLGVVFREGDNLFVSSFAQSFRLTFPLAYSPRDTVFNFLGENPAAMSTVPQMVLIDRNGTIRYQSPIGGDSTFFDEKILRSRIEELLKEPVGKTTTKPASKKKPS
jgi:peroxiredoxin